MDCLLSIIRKPHGLVALVSRVLRHLDPVNDVPAKLGIDSSSGLYEIIESPLELLTSSLFPQKDALIASWNYLSCVDELNSEVLFHILVVVINTVWEPLESEFVLPNLPPENMTKQVIKPTAANPRAYKGTKYKPPKPKVISQFDLRLYLCDRKYQNQLLSRLGQYWVDALLQFEKAGYDISYLSSKILSITTEQRNFHPYYGFNHNLYIPGDYPALPTIFHRYLWFSLKGLVWADVTDYLSVYWQFELDENFENKQQFLFALSRLINLQNNRNTWEWCRIIVQQPESLRLIFTTVIIETQIYSLKPTDLLISGIEQLHQIIGENDCEFIDRQCNDQFSNPIPRKIRDYLLGKISLKEGQINRAWGLIEKNIQLTQLEILENTILQALKREFDVDPQQEDIKHALAMLGSIDDNFRPFRKFLKAYWENNDSNYLLNHPLSQSWLKQHPAMAANINLWMQGITRSYSVELVCFYIYPHNIHTHIKSIFYEYNIMFANALGLTLYQDSPDKNNTYDIVNIISQSWWDDDAWDFSLS